MEFRKEYDSMGEVLVPATAYYGAQTARAMANFGVSGLVFQPVFFRALGLIKKYAAMVNRELGLLDEERAGAITAAADAVISGSLNDQFLIDVFQTGSGTSTNMNMNEVIAGKANEILTGARGGKSPVHPNDHVNKGQSSNDVIPTAIHLAAMLAWRLHLKPALEDLYAGLANKAREFASIKKIGRTHLQDAVPITLGAEFGAYARQIELGIARITRVEPSMLELALGGTAVGNGLNAHPKFAGRVIAMTAEAVGIPFCEARNHFEAQAAQDAAVEMSGALKTVAVSLTKIANDIRLLASGPRCGIGEIAIPSLQPGSSIMPGKVNPVMPEMMIQASAQVIANDTAITLGGQWGVLELNVMLPFIAYNLIQSIELLANTVSRFQERCIAGITADEEQCRSRIERSLAMSTALAPVIGYERAAEISKKAFASGRTVREVATEEAVLPADELQRLLDSMLDS